MNTGPALVFEPFSVTCDVEMVPFHSSLLAHIKQFA
nr:MAG TPA: hypothetical protein [Caudoviricetes sp.]